MRRVNEEDLIPGKEVKLFMYDEGADLKKVGSIFEEDSLDIWSMDWAVFAALLVLIVFAFTASLWTIDLALGGYALMAQNPGLQIAVANPFGTRDLFTAYHYALYSTILLFLVTAAMSAYYYHKNWERMKNEPN